MKTKKSRYNDWQNVAVLRTAQDELALMFQLLRARIDAATWDSKEETLEARQYLNMMAANMQLQVSRKMKEIEVRTQGAHKSLSGRKRSKKVTQGNGDNGSIAVIH